MKRFIVALILSTLLFSQPAAAFWQGGGSGSVEVGTTGQVLKTSGTSSLVWGEGNELSSWYLPSAYELGLLYQQKDIIGGLSGYYWASNESSASYANYKNMNDNSGGVQLKQNSSGVRPIRSFDVTYATGKYAIGDTLGSGKVFYVDATGKKGLVSALNDQPAAMWYNGTNISTGADGSSVYAGKSNTIKIIDVQGTGSYAAISCRDYAPSSSGGGAPTDATYITQVSNGTLTAEQALGSLSTGIIRNTTATGVLSIAVAGTDYVMPNTAITAGTGTKVSYDSKGLVTSSTNATLDDIADGVNRFGLSELEKSGLHTQGTDQGLDTGGVNAVTAAQAKAAYTHSGIVTGNPHAVTSSDVGLGNVTNNAQYYAGGTDVAISDGGTGQSTQQAAINALTAVAGATNEHVLTKDTTTGNAIFKASTGGGGVTSFNTRTGAVTPATNDYTWAQVDKTTSSLADIVTKSHTSLTDIGSNNHTAIDTFVSSKAAASGLASLDASSKVVQDPANAVVTPAASKIPIADGSGKLDGWVTATIPGGANSQIQYNSNGAFGGDEGLIYSPSSKSLGIMESATNPTSSPNYEKIYAKPATDAEYISDGFTSLLLHANGNAANFVDSSGIPKTMTAFGATTQSTTQSKFGGKSAYFSGAAADYLEASAHTDLDFGAGDFTIDFWFFTNSTNRQFFIAASSDQHFGIDYSYEEAGSKKIGIWASSTGNSWNLLHADGGGNGRGNIALNLNSWNHIAFVRNGNRWMSFVNGILDVDVTVVGTITPLNGENVRIGRHGSSLGYMVNGYIDELRISKGIARWTSNFIPQSGSPAGLFCKTSNDEEYIISAWTQDGDNLTTTKGIALTATGNKISIKEGANASVGVVGLVAGVATVSNTLVTANSKIFLSRVTGLTNAGTLTYAITSGTSFTITSSNAADVGNINWWILESIP